MVNSQKSILHRAVSVHREALNDGQICQDEQSQMLSITLSLSACLRLFLSHFPLFLSHALDTRSDKKLRTVKSEPDRTCPQHSQNRTEIKHLRNCCDHNLQNTKLPQLSALRDQALE